MRTRSVRTPAGRARRTVVLAVAVGGWALALSLRPSSASPAVAVQTPPATSLTIATAAPAPPSVPLPTTVAPPVPSAAPRPACRAAVLVHGGGYFAGDAGALEASWAAPLRDAGYLVWNVDYPLLADWPDLAYDPDQAWYPRPDVDSTPATLRTVHDRATEAVAPRVADALATGCRVVLVGVSAGGSIVADLAHRFPQVAEAVLVVGASLTPDRIGGAPIQVFYGADDDVVLPAASVATCERWRAAGSVCTAHRFEGAGHLSPDQPAAALAHLVGPDAGRPLPTQHV